MLAGEACVLLLLRPYAEIARVVRQREPQVLLLLLLLIPTPIQGEVLCARVPVCMLQLPAQGIELGCYM